MATAPYCFPYPAAATYPPPPFHDAPFPFPAPTQIHGHLHHTPFPFFPTYASSFPYPPPASVYMPASSFSPIWPTWPPPAPDPTPYTAPFNSSSTTTSSPPNFPVASGNNFSPAAPPIPPGDLETRTTGAPLPATSTSWYPTHHTSVNLPVQATPQLNAAPAAPDREYRPPQRHAFTPTSTPCDETEEDNGALPRYDCAFQTGKSGNAFHSSASRMQPVLAPETLADLTPLLNLPVATDFFLDRLHSSSSAAAKDSTTTPSAPPLDRVVPYVFDRAPEVASSGAAASVSFGSPVSSTITAPTPFFGFTSSTGSTTTRAASYRLLSAPSMSPSTAIAYDTPQVFGEMPAQNSWHGTHVTTPNYSPGHEKPIQNSSLQSLSTGPNWQNLDEMPQAYGLHNLNRHSVFLADGTERSYFALPENYPLERATPEPVFDVYADETEDCSNVFVDVLADSFGQSNAFVDVLARNSVQQPYDVEQRQSHRAPKCFSNPNFSPERPIVGTDIEQPLHLSIDEELQDDEKLLGEQSVCQSAIEHSFLNFLWDPGDARLHTLFTTSARATKFPSTHAYKCAMIHIPVGQFGASRAPSFQCAIMLSAVFGLGWTALHASALFLLVAPCSTDKYRCLPSFAMSKQVQWDPGIAISNLWIFISQPVDLKQFWSQLLLQRHSCSWKIAQEKEKVMVGLNPKQWTFSFNAMPYCQICEKCIAMSYQLYWHEDINFNEIHLWLIHFQPP